MRSCLVAVLLLSACSIDLGTTSATACTPSPALFVSDVWPRYLVANQCGSAACHAFVGGHGTLRLRDVSGEHAPAVSVALNAWSLGWRENYLSATHQLNCNSPLESPLLTMPEGNGDLHPRFSLDYVKTIALSPDPPNALRANYWIGALVLGMSVTGHF
jgi:hypothetical protein